MHVYVCVFLQIREATKFSDQSMLRMLCQLTQIMLPHAFAFKRRISNFDSSQFLLGQFHYQHFMYFISMI